MRISTNKNDPGYVSDNKLYKVFFCGSERKNVITADEEKRYVVVYSLDNKGLLIPNKDRTDFITETLYGDVYIQKVEDKKINNNNDYSGDFTLDIILAAVDNSMMIDFIPAKTLSFNRNHKVIFGQRDIQQHKHWIV